MQIQGTDSTYIQLTNDNTEENIMTIKNYMENLKAEIQTEIGKKEKEWDDTLLTATDEESCFINGVIVGLRIALEKIDAVELLDGK